MAKAMCWYRSASKTTSGFVIPVEILYIGDDVLEGVGDQSYIEVEILAGQTLAQINTNVVNAVLADATYYGYPLIASDVVFPGMMTG